MTTNPPYGQDPDHSEGPPPTPADPPTHPVSPAELAFDPAGLPVGSAAPVAGPPSDGGLRRRRRMWVVAGSMAAAVVLLGGGTAAALLAASTFPHGAATPDEAVTAFVKAAQSKRLVAMGSMIAPSELSLVRQAMSDVRPPSGAPSPDPEQAEALAAVWDSLTIDAAGIETSSEQIAGDVSIVSLTRGSITIDADPEALSRLIDAAGAAASPLGSTLGSTLPSEDAEEALADLTASLPYTLTAADAAEELGFDPALVAVEEGGKWYVSAAMTIAELVFADAAKDNPALQRGTPLSAEETGALGDAQAAASQFTAGLGEVIASGDVRTLAAALPEAEARVVAVYGPAIWGRGDAGPGGLTLEALEVSPVRDDDGRVRFGLDLLSLTGPTWTATVSRDDPDLYTLDVKRDSAGGEASITGSVRATGDDNWHVDYATTGDTEADDASGSVDLAIGPDEWAIDIATTAPDGESTGTSITLTDDCLSYEDSANPIMATRVCASENPVVGETIESINQMRKAIPHLPRPEALAGFTAIESDGGWRVSLTSSLLDIAATVFPNGIQ
ncbi:MAG: hypothetical protein LBK59_10910 [Bifidobacteriaceae bacterium]|jgi:hypothetical protein|nr:hypothetical protein [Bifidobacteriaceae bacterium]